MVLVNRNLSVQQRRIVLAVIPVIPLSASARRKEKPGEIVGIDYVAWLEPAAPSLVDRVASPIEKRPAC